MSTSNPQNYTTVADRVSFTPREHHISNKEIDDKLKVELGAKKISSSIELDYMLDLIIRTSKRRLQKTDIPARSLIEDADFMQLINRCFDEGVYDDLRRLDIFQPQTVSNVTISEGAINKAWREAYVGEEHKLLFENIAGMVWNHPYANTASIIQSSGTGKSRLVYEYAALVFTISFNLRAETENKSLAFPRPNSGIRRRLTDHCSDPMLQEIYYLLFFAYLFRRLNQELSSMDIGKQKTYADLAVLWRTHLDDHQNVIYDDVIDALDSRQAKSSQLGGNGGTLTKEAASRDKEELTNPELVAASSEANDELKKLLAIINENVEETTTDIPGRRIPTLVMYFDEAHTLTLPVDDWGTSKTLYDALCSAINHFRPQLFFSLFLSTASKLYQFAPPPKAARSSRMAMAQIVQAPITEVPFDCSPKFPIQQNVWKLQDVAKIEFLAQFGRPLFWTLMNAGIPEEQIIDLASEKLLCSTNIEQPELWSDNAVLALLDVQTTLDYEPRRHAARELEAELVASHMRVAYSVPSTREYVRSGYSSEPILAEVAARLINRMNAQQSPQSSSWDVLAIDKFLKNGFLDRGEIGEFIGRHLLTKAYMRRVAKATEVLSGGVKLVDFLKELISEGEIESILDCRADHNHDGPTLREAFEEAYVRFTHWIKMADDWGTSTYAATAAFLRCAAIICRTNGPTVDMIIPILMWDTAIGEWAISGILIQMKRRRKAGTINAYQIDEHDINFFPKTSTIPDQNFQKTTSRPAPDRRPYISLVMELGVQLPIPPEAYIPVAASNPPKPPPKSTQGKEDKKRPRTNDDAQSTPKRPRTGIQLATPSRIALPGQSSRPLHHNKTVHPRYNIFIYGCSHVCYNVIEKKDKDLYAKILCTRDLLAEHPRRDPQSIATVRRMKPFFSAGQPSYQWFECPQLGSDDTRQDSETVGILSGSFDEDAADRLQKQVDAARDRNISVDEDEDAVMEASDLDVGLRLNSDSEDL